MAALSDVPWLGAVLCGGRSRRMGEDKAWLAIEGITLAERVAAAIGDALGSSAVMVGGDEDAARARGFVWVADEMAGEGPVGGVLSALGFAQRSGCGGVLVAACDQPSLEPGALRLLIGATRRSRHGCADEPADEPADETADEMVVARFGRDHLPAAVPVSVATTLRERFVMGERSLRGAFEGIVVELAAPLGMVRDLDTPDEVAAWRAAGLSPTARLDRL